MTEFPLIEFSRKLATEIQQEMPIDGKNITNAIISACHYAGSEDTRFSVDLNINKSIQDEAELLMHIQNALRKVANEVEKYRLNKY